jgi:type IV secretory pathway ATPase VirB11/archaellum biosynthesis ATPase
MINDMNRAKGIFKQELAKGNILKWIKLQEICFEQEVTFEYVSILNNWYTQVTELCFLDDTHKDTEEILFHSAEASEVIIKGEKSFFGHDLTTEDLEIVLQIICIKNNIEWNFKHPFQSFYFKIFNKDLRISLIHSSITTENNSKAFFRFLNSKTISIEKYTDSSLLKKMVKEKKNILIAGATGSGKTTLVNSLIDNIPMSDHLLILEDTKELISPHEQTTRLLSNKEHNQSLDTLLTYGLRVSPQRIVLGEMRSHEVITFILAMNTGHSGMMTTLHANSAKDSISRIAMMFMMYGNSNLSYEMVLKLICQNIDHVIFIENKEIKEIIDIYGSENSSIFFEKIA